MYIKKLFFTKSQISLDIYRLAEHNEAGQAAEEGACCEKMGSHTILERIRYYAMNTPHQLAVIDEGVELTYEEYWEKICGVATRLKQLGVEKNECILVKNTQSVNYLITCHGIQLCGAVCVPVEKGVNDGRVLELMQETAAKKFFGNMKLQEYDCYSIDDICENQAALAADFVMPNLEDTAMILFTTGTTGKSKGIVIQYSAEYAVAENVVCGVEMKKGNVEIIPMPMNHSFSLRRYFANMINGSTVIILDGVFFVKRLFEMIEKYHVTALALAPAAISIIFKLTKDKIGSYENQLDYIQLGSAPLPEGDKEHLLRILPSVRLYNLYGSTELGVSCALNFNSEDNQPSCIGYPTKNSIFKIVDENGNEKLDATAESPGFLSYTGTMKMKEYFNESALTEETVIDGYLHSSDLGYRDEKGRIFMLGRADDVIITGGNKVSPLEVEEVARRCFGVHDCICKSREDALVGAVPVLYVVVDDHFTMEELEHHLRDYLENFKRPRHIQRVAAIPRTYNGKLDRKTSIEGEI